MFPLWAAGDVDAIISDSTKRIIVTVVASAVTAAAAFVFGRYYGRWKARRQWESKEFLHRVIVSLNIFRDGFLKIRTVMERNLDEMFLNPIAVEIVQKAAQRCTEAEPLLALPPKDRWFVVNFVLNAVAEHFIAGQIRQDAGQPVTLVKYSLFLTCELVGDERVRKVRAMLLRTELLEDFPYGPENMPKFENPWHADRINTLRIAAARYKTEPDLFLTLEASV
jgi:hypothetical protein